MERQAKDGTFYRQVGKDEWEVVTRTAKDGTVYKKVGKDEWTPIEAPRRDQGPQASVGEKIHAAIEGFAKSASLGTLPYLKAGADYLTDRLAGIPTDVVSFDERVRRAREQGQAVAEKAPGYHLAGEVAGFVAPGAGAARLVGRGAQMAARVAPRAAQAMQAASPLAQQSVRLGAEGAVLGAAYTPESGFADVGARLEAAGSGLVGGALIPTAGQALKKTGEAIARSQPGQAAARAFAKAGSALTGVAQKEIETFIARAKAVNETIKKYGNDISEGVDAFRDRTLGALRSKRSELSQAITRELDSASPEKIVSARFIIDKLDEIKKTLSPNLESEAVKQIDEMIQAVSAEAGETGALSLGELFKVKEFLQDRAKGAYMKAGQLFSTAKQSQRAAKIGGAAARKILNEVSPEIAKANNQLSMLHQLESEMQRSLLKRGTSPSSVLSAGSGANTRNARMLSRVDEVTGGQALQEAENLASARTFANPSLLPQDATGKTMTRMAVAGGIGYLFDGPEGAAIGAAFSSPFALKQAIRLGRIPAKVFSKLAGGAKDVTEETFARAAKALETPEGRALVLREFVNKGSGAATRVAEKDEAPKRGHEKWANDGFDKVLKHTTDQAAVKRFRELKSELLKDKRARRLFIQASDLRPGTRAMDNVVKKLEELKAERAE